MTYNAATLRQ